MNDRRRLLVALGAGALAVPLLSFAQQQPAKIPRIGFLGLASASGYASQVEALRAGLHDLGYAEGKNLVIEFRWAEGKYDRLPELATELVRLKVDVIVTHGTPGVRAAKKTTTTIPIVMAAVGDAVATGLVASLARPGGNVTGSTFFSPELHAKRLELIKEAMPNITRVGMLGNPENPVFVADIKLVNVAAKSMKVELQRFLARGPDDFESVFSAMAKNHVQAVLIEGEPMTNVNSKALATIATKYHLAAAGNRAFADSGGLVGYGQNNLEVFRRAAYFVDKILKGAKPGDLPIERTAKFDLVVNLKTAKALGIKIPQQLLQRANKVIE